MVLKNGKLNCETRGFSGTPFSGKPWQTYIPVSSNTDLILCACLVSQNPVPQPFTSLKRKRLKSLGLFTCPFGEIIDLWHFNHFGANWTSSQTSKSAHLPDETSSGHGSMG